MNSISATEPHFDAVVVGARVAGSATALLLTRAGLRVLVVDRGAPGQDTVSTLALMRGAVLQLRRWGLLDALRAQGTPAIRRTTFHYGENTAVVSIKERDGVDALYAPRRTVLDATLAGAAAGAGARFAWQAQVRGLLRDSRGRVRGVRVVDATGTTREVAAEIVIGADGASSGVAREAGAAIRREGRSPSSLIYGYWSGPALDGTHWLYGRGVAAGAVPTNGGQACVFAAMPPARFRQARPAEFADLHLSVIEEADGTFAETLRHGRWSGRLVAFPGRPGFLRQAWGPGWALVGDAGCFKDPITAHGMTDALRDAGALARAVTAGTDRALAGYEEERDTFAVPFLDLSDAVASFAWDYEEVQALHLRLGKLMNNECDHLRAVERSEEAATAGAAEPPAAA